MHLTTSNIPIVFDMLICIKDYQMWSVKIWCFNFASMVGIKYHYTTTNWLNLCKNN